MNKTLSRISIIALAGAATFTGGCATHREVVAAPPPAVATTDQTTTTTTDQAAPAAVEPARRGPRG